MATKTIIVGKQSRRCPGKRIPIEFNRYISSNGKVFDVVDGGVLPSQYSHIELLVLDYGRGLDVMLAYNNPEYRYDGMIYLGKWNDGVVN